MTFNRNQLLGLAAAGAFVAALLVVWLADPLHREWRWYVGLVTAGLALQALAHFTPPKVRR